MTYTVTARFDDLSESVYLTFISDSGDVIMDMPASEFARIREDQNNSIESIREMLNERSYTYCNVVVKAAVDNYNNTSDEMRFRYTAVRSQQYDMKEENNMLLRRLNLYKNK